MQSNPNEILVVEEDDDTSKNLRNLIIVENNSINLEPMKKFWVPNDESAPKYWQLFLPLKKHNFLVELEKCYLSHFFGVKLEKERTSLKKSPLTHICLICLDSGEALHECFKSYSDCSKSNAWKHLDQKHKCKSREDCHYKFQRIIGLVGQTLPAGVARTKLTSDGKIVNEGTTGKQDLVKAIAAWAARSGQSLDVTECALFRNVLDAARRTGSSTNLNVGRYALKSKILEMAEDLKKEKKKNLDLPDFRVFIIFDGWDASCKIISISASYLYEQTDSTLKYDVIPLSFSSPTYDPEVDNLAARTNTIELMKHELEDFGLTIKNVAGGMSDNAVRSTLAQLNKPALTHYLEGSGMKVEDFNDSSSEAMSGCLSHLCNLVAKYATGQTISKGAEIPGAPDHNVRRLIELTTASTQYLQTTKNYERAKLEAKKKNKKVWKSATANETRWGSLYNQILVFTKNYSLLQTIRKETDLPTLYELSSILEIEAILNDFMVIQKLSQTTKSPFGYATLPMIFVILNHFNVDLSNGLLDASNVDGNYEEADVYFNVLGTSDAELEAGTRQAKFLSDFSGTGSKFFICFVKHLIFRFVQQRRNIRFYEIVGMFIDPVMKEFCKNVCSKTRSSKFNYESMLSITATFISKFSSNEEIDPIVSSNNNNNHKRIRSCLSNSDTDGNTTTTTSSANSPKALDELQRFLGTKFEQAGDLELLGSLEGFADKFNSYDPIPFWNNSFNRNQYPMIYKANMVTLAYQSSSAFAEAGFSSSGINFTKQRNRLYENPRLLSAVHLLNNHFTRESSEKKNEWILLKKEEKKQVNEQEERE